MPFYKFLCNAGHETEEFRPLRKFVEKRRCRCGKMARLAVNRDFMISAFKPYTEHHMAGQPIEITSRRQRDELCAKHGVTYDSAKYASRRKPQTAVEDLSFATVKETLESGRTPDGEKLEEPVKIARKERRKYKDI